MHSSQYGCLEKWLNANSVNLSDANEYGALVPCNELLVHCREHVGYRTRVLVLEAQRDPMKILRNIVRGVLKSLRDQDSSGDAEWKRRGAEGCRTRLSTTLTPIDEPLSFSPIESFYSHTRKSHEQWISQLPSHRRIHESKVAALQIDPAQMHVHIKQLIDTAYYFSPDEPGKWLASMEAQHRWGHMATTAWESDYNCAKDLYYIEQLAYFSRFHAQGSAHGAEASASDAPANFALLQLSAISSGVPSMFHWQDWIGLCLEGLRSPKRISGDPYLKFAATSYSWTLPPTLPLYARLNGILHRFGVQRWSRFPGTDSGHAQRPQ